MRDYLPEFFKSIIRFFYYKNERRKLYSNIRIRRVQDQGIDQYSVDTKRLIVFIVPGADWFTGKDKISGGILSISSIYEETVKLKSVHGAEAIMCTLPGEFLLLRHSMFPNEIDVFRFDQIQRHFTSLEEILFHVPEYLVPSFHVHWIKVKERFSDIFTHVNILNQRIDIMPTPEQVASLALDVDKVTQTTAHEKYTNAEIHKRYGIPLHKLSVFGSPERYKRESFEAKKKFITFSPDPHHLKHQLVEMLRVHLPDFMIREVHNLTYTQYLSWVGETQFTITLGEGLDFYFIETVFSGGVAFTLDKGDFFTEDFTGVPGIFKSINEMKDKLVGSIQQLNNPVIYQQWNEQQFTACAKLYRYNEYVINLEKFYREEYTYL